MRITPLLVLVLVGCSQPLNELTLNKERIYKSHKDYVSVARNIRNGFRVNEWNSNKEIWALGGSGTFGYGLNDNETWPWILGITNYGQSGFALHDETYLLVQLLIEGKRPKTVIFYDGVNEQWCPDVDRAFYLRKLLKEEPFNTDFNHRNQTLTTTQYRRCAEQYYGRYAQFIQEIGLLYGFTPIFILQPHEQVSNLFYSQYYDAIMSQGYSHDLRNILKDKDVFIDWQHPNGEGNKIIADHIRKLLYPSDSR